jgi:hypothetical protein
LEACAQEQLLGGRQRDGNEENSREKVDGAQTCATQDRGKEDDRQKEDGTQAGCPKDGREAETGGAKANDGPQDHCSKDYGAKARSAKEDRAQDHCAQDNCAKDNSAKGDDSAQDHGAKARGQAKDDSTKASRQESGYVRRRERKAHERPAPAGRSRRLSCASSPRLVVGPAVTAQRHLRRRGL